MPGKYISPATRQQCRDLYHAGMKIESIAKQLHISYSSAKKHAHATGSTADKPKSGRPRKLTGKKRRVVRRLAQNGHSTRIVAILLGTRHGVSVSRMTVNRALKMGRKPLQYLPVIRGRRLSDVNQLKRVAFCQQSTRQQWHKIIFADSKFLYVYEDKARGWLFKWQNADSREVVPQHSNPFVFHFYAAVGTGFKSSLVFVPPTRGEGVEDPKKKTTFKSEHFLVAVEQLHDEIQRGFSGGAEYSMVLDHARQHTSKASKAGLAKFNVLVLEGFPPQSWDLNAIEVCWSWLDQKLRGHNPRTWDGWKDAIIQAWKEVEVVSIDKLVKKVPQQVEKIIKADGKWCKYFP
jgi:transposase